MYKWECAAISKQKHSQLPFPVDRQINKVRKHFRTFIFCVNFWAELDSELDFDSDLSSFESALCMHFNFIKRLRIFYRIEHGQICDIGSRYQDFGSYRIPGTMYPSQSWVLGRTKSSNYPQRQGTRSRRRHFDPFGIWKRSQEIEINVKTMFTNPQRNTNL